MENAVEVRACFTGCNIKSGKTVMQFELDPEYKGALPRLAMMTGTFVTLDISSDQTVLFVDRETGEDAGEELFPEEEDGAYQLPPAAYEFEDAQDEAA